MRKAARKAVRDAIDERQNQHGANGKNGHTGAGDEKPGKPSPGKGPTADQGDAREPAGPGAKPKNDGRGGKPEDIQGRDGPGKPEGAPPSPVPTAARRGSSPAATARVRATRRAPGRETPNNPAKAGGTTRGAATAPAPAGRTPPGGTTGPTGRPTTACPLPAKPEKGLHHESGDLQLQDWRKGLDELRKSGKFSEAYLNDLSGRFEQLEANHRAKPKEATVAPRNGGPLRSTGGQVKSTGTGGNPGDLKAGATPQPPAAYRDAYRQFNKPKAEGGEAK